MPDEGGQVEASRGHPPTTNFRVASRGQVEDTHRPRTSASLPGGRFHDVYAGHQGASRRKAARPDDTTRTPRYRGPGPGRTADVACAAWAKIGMATNPSAVMLVDPRKGGNKHRHENGGDSTGRDGVFIFHRSVGCHDFVTILRTGRSCYIQLASPHGHYWTSCLMPD